MGRLETGRTTTSDPAMATGASPWPGAAGPHPDVPDARRVPPKWSRAAACRSARARTKDECWDADEEAAMFARHRGEGEL